MHLNKIVRYCEHYIILIISVYIVFGYAFEWLQNGVNILLLIAVPLLVWVYYMISTARNSWRLVTQGRRDGFYEGYGLKIVETVVVLGIIALCICTVYWVVLPSLWICVYFILLGLYIGSYVISDMYGYYCRCVANRE